MFGTIAGLLRVLAKVAGARGIDAGIVDAMIFAGNLIEEGMEGHAELKALTQRIQTLVDEGRHFTEAERAELRAQSDAAHSRLQALADDVPQPELDMAEDDAGEVEADDAADEPVDPEPAAEVEPDGVPEADDPNTPTQ